MSFRCQACHSANVRIFYEVERIPVHSCLMVSTRDEAIDFPRGDLRLGHCADCGFIQNSAFDAHVQNYNTDYEETQGFSPRFQKFLTEIVEDQIARYDLRDKTCLEIGCGKGEFLVELCEKGPNRGIGVDPSYRPERTTSEAASRIEFIQDLYSEKYTHLRADYIACRHTLEHIGPVHEFVRMIRNTLDEKPDTVVFFELPDVERVLEERAFWDMYYEHCTYFTLGSLARLFRACDFELLDLYKVYDGQYLMIECKPVPAGEGARGKHFDTEDDLEKTDRQVREFETKIQQKFEGLRADLDRWQREGRKPVVWGSGSKGVSYLTTLGLTDEIEVVVDINPHKHGKYLAGTGHIIVGPDDLVDVKPDVVLVMNPIYVEEIRADLAKRGLTPELVPMD
ncbi:MAG: methyltransferase domain-containing protein [Planctomycetes bacterium]|nr:methyltransferase domain-containing protein [Planctomycetota bacterium]